MSDHNHPVRPRTAVLTAGFDPTLSVGSARPAVFRSSTYVFPSPEQAEHAFAIITGKIKPENGDRADLIYSRFSHPNAEILEDQIVPLDAGGRYAAVFNSGMAAIMTADRKSTRLNSSHPSISYAVFCLKKKTTPTSTETQCKKSTITTINSR